MSSFDWLTQATPRVVLADGGDGSKASLRIEGRWQAVAGKGPAAVVWQGRLVNTGGRPQAVKEIVLFDGPLPCGPSTPIYAEAFQKLAQTAGTLAEPKDIGYYPDRTHYKLPQVPGAFTVRSMLLLGPIAGAAADAPYAMVAASSCRRFDCEIRLRPDATAQIALAAEGLAIEPGATWQLEELFASAGGREELLEALAARIAIHHPPLAFAPVPTGWCSWYCYGPSITPEILQKNLDAIAARIPALKYVQIDDGYQTAMGDWLILRPELEATFPQFLADIRRRGLEAAIWVGPFIAEEGSVVFREHPEWFVQDASGAPLRSDRLGFGGWRNGPWYMLDGTHPGAQEYLERVFRTMRQEWGVSYFKLDANAWGALPGGVHHDRRATSIEAYRRGMAAVRRGAGDAFILGCNAPMWGSLGLVHGMRITNDIGRAWASFKAVAGELFGRNWQNGRLWINDPDCVILADWAGCKPSADEYLFHATMIYASGGMVLSGDDIDQMPDDRLAQLAKLLPATGVAAKFIGEGYRVGVVDLPGKRMACLFNWTDGPQTVEAPLAGRAAVRDFWSGEDLGLHEGTLRIEMPPHAGRLLECRAV